jgi:hypothetical protein
MGDWNEDYLTNEAITRESEQQTCEKFTPCGEVGWVWVGADAEQKRHHAQAQ